jgi:hypothetical protein
MILPTDGSLALMMMCIPDEYAGADAKLYEPLADIAEVAITLLLLSVNTAYRVWPRLVAVSLALIIPFPFASSNMLPLIAIVQLLTVAVVVTDTLHPYVLVT